MFLKIRQALLSIKLTIVCLALLLLLVFLCTLAQVRLGTFGAVDVYIRSLFVYWTPPGSSLKIPIFPGGGLIGLVLLMNLTAVQFGRLERRWSKAGLWVSHLGLVIFFVGEFVTGFFQVETQMAIEEGMIRNYTEDSREVELVVADVTGPDYDEVYAMPQSLLRRRSEIKHERLPFGVRVKRFFPNAVLESVAPVQEGFVPQATQGAGLNLRVSGRPAVSRDDEINQPAAFVELVSNTGSLGVWLAALALDQEQDFTWQDRRFKLAMRMRRRYLPYSIKLKDFRHEIYPGTDIPRHFSSLVRLMDPEKGENRDVLISMNKPLRYQGKTFYQASFGRNDTLSVLQVVRNPGWLLPYGAFALMAIGLGFHFLTRLEIAWRKQA